MHPETVKPSQGYETINLPYWIFRSVLEGLWAPGAHCAKRIAIDVCWTYKFMRFSTFVLIRPVKESFV